MSSTTDARQTFETFLHERERVARAYVNGEADPLDAITTRLDPATFFPPKGGHVRGAAAVLADYTAGVRAFTAPSTSRLEIFQSGASGDLAFWTGLQHAEVRLADGGRVVPMVIRVTEVFRHEDGGWKLVHRHADADPKPHPEG